MPKIAEQKAEIVYRSAKGKAKEYTISDGRGLYMVVTPDGSRLWDFRYSIHGRRRKLAIRGGYPAVGVKAAREEADRLRAMVARGEDPAEVRKSGEMETARRIEEERQERAKVADTFEKVGREWHAKAAEHVVPLHSIMVLQRLEKEVFPWVGDRPISDIRPPDILAPLQKVEERGARETAHRLLGVCSQIFRYAVATGRLESDPTRDLRGALARPKEGHFAALTNPEDVAGLLRSIDGYSGGLETRTALLLGILTFVRPGNLRYAEWTEFHDLENPEGAEWRIPGDKMKIKTKRPFVIPLAPQAVQLLEALRPLTGRSRFVFRSLRSPERPMSNMAVLSALRRMGYTSDEMTGHGVRAMARTICHEVLGFAPEVIEEQLAHGKAGPLGGAYDRTTHMPERRRLMREWADYLDGLKAGEVTR
jgi:integrase